MVIRACTISEQENGVENKQPAPAGFLMSGGAMHVASGFGGLMKFDGLR